MEGIVGCCGAGIVVVDVINCCKDLPMKLWRAHHTFLLKSSGHTLCYVSGDCKDTVIRDA